MKLITPSGAKHSEQKGKGEEKTNKQAKKNKKQYKWTVQSLICISKQTECKNSVSYQIHNKTLFAALSYSEEHKTHTIPLTPAKCKQDIMLQEDELS